MRKQVLAVVLFCCLALFTSAQKYHPDYQDGAIWLKLKPAEELLTKKKEKLTIDDVRVLKPLKEKFKLKKVEKPFYKIRKASPLQDTYLLTFDEMNQADKLIKELQESGLLEYAEKVPLNKTSDVPNNYIDPNDYNVSNQWHLNAINAPGAWNIHTASSNTILAIVDDAVQTTHPDLSSNIWQNPGEIAGDGIDNDGNNYVDDVNGWDFASNDNNPNPTPTTLDHGTHVAGIASATTNNGTGIASIGYSAKLMCVKTSNDPGYITYGYSGIIYAADNGADVINLSWGSSTSSITAQNIINYALGKGCIIVAAAGNSNTNSILYPAAYPGVISVAATDNSDHKAWFSNYASGITISAPGDNIYSTTVGGGYGVKSGTSMASPLVAGLVALMHSYNPTMPNSDLINCLKSSATNIEGLNPSYAGMLGSGRINAGAAMQCIGAQLSRAPVANFSANNTTVSVGGQIKFSDSSAYAPTSWSWSFPGGTPSTSGLQNPPTIVYNAPGNYMATLTVSNASGSSIKTSSIKVNSVSECDMVNYETSKIWTPALYSPADVPAYGSVTGMNLLEEKQKAKLFDVSYTSAAYITNVYIWFGTASTNNSAKSVTIRVYDGTTGSPGSQLGIAVLTMADIINSINQRVYARADFKLPVSIPASRKFFISVDMSNLCWSCYNPGDRLAIVSNMDSQTLPPDTWEQWDDGTWHRYDTPDSWEYDISLYMFPSITNSPVIAKFIASPSTICEGSSVFFDATGSINTSGLSWSFAGGTPSSVSNNMTPSVAFNTPGDHLVTLTVQGGGCNEVRDSTVTINVNENVTPSVSLTSNTDAPGIPVTFTAKSTYGGQNPLFSFKKNGELMQSGTSDTWNHPGLADGDVVSCTLSSNYSCVTTAAANSNSITIISNNSVTSAVLPVELLYLKGSSANGTNLLQWATASEINTDKFIVERSDDGTRFYTAGSVKAKGESNTTLTYQFQDARTGSVYYRLRMVDTDGSYQFSRVIFLGRNSSAESTLWPNPVTLGQEVKWVLTGRNTTKEVVQVIDAFGKVIEKKTVAIIKGKLETGIQTQYLTPGLYFITIANESGKLVQQEKLIVLK